MENQLNQIKRLESGLQRIQHTYLLNPQRMYTGSGREPRPRSSETHTRYRNWKLPRSVHEYGTPPKDGAFLLFFPLSFFLSLCSLLLGGDLEVGDRVCPTLTAGFAVLVGDRISVIYTKEQQLSCSIRASYSWINIYDHTQTHITHHRSTLAN